MAQFTFDADALGDALEAAGYDVEPAGGDAGVLRARRDGVAGGVASAAIDRGGRLKWTLTRPTAPERARDVTAAGLRCRLVDSTARTSVAVLTLPAGPDLAALLADLERLAAR